jgi:hypothetical protein
MSLSTQPSRILRLGRKRQNMLELDQLTEVLASVSRDKILLLFAPDDRLNANQVCKKLGLPISKVRRVRSALRRLSDAGDLLECVSASFAGLRKSAPTYMVLCIPSTPPATGTNEETEVALPSTPSQRPSLTLPRTPPTPDYPCWEQYEAKARRKHKSLLRRHPHREKTPLVVPCPICREAVVETFVPF